MTREDVCRVALGLEMNVYSTDEIVDILQDALSCLDTETFDPHKDSSFKLIMHALCKSAGYLDQMSLQEYEIHRANCRDYIVMMERED